MRKVGRYRQRLRRGITGFVITAVLGFLAGCVGLPKNVANCPITPTPPANTSIVPPAQEPPAAALCGFPLTIASPGNGANVESPIPLVAEANPPDPIYTLRVYVDGLAVLYTPRSSLNQLIWMANGRHIIELVAEDVAGYIATTSMQANVTSQGPGALNIQDSFDWVSCSAVIVNSTCAAGLGVATSTLALHQARPSLDGSAARFSLSGKTAYSNELYWTPIGGGNSVSHFTYDLYFYIDHGNAPQSLEFDVNQTFGNTRWTWGTQCDFNQTHEWNVWDPFHGIWVPIPIPCNHFPSETWIHLVWQLERIGNRVHYISVNVADHTYPVDVYYDAQPKWDQEEIDIAFQMDGNYKQEPFNVWLDKVNLLAH
ncbi:MAG TPA: hypothetical protein VMP68_12100 [Candidatus Eisenbacteria bacterium]|nr:hypothetical protein [Candidatus Eisenbacteria bacterium]